LSIYQANDLQFKELIFCSLRGADLNNVANLKTSSQCHVAIHDSLTRFPASEITSIKNGWHTASRFRSKHDTFSLW
jgi:hypothetical protein